MTAPGGHPAVISDLGRRVRGPVLSAEDAGYPALCKWFVGGQEDVHPRAVVRCADPADVAEALRYVHTRRLPFSVRSGGHSYAEHSWTDGVLLDLGLLDSVEMGDGVVRVGPGARIGQLTVALAGHGRLVPLGWCSTVGVGGSVLGGGFGPYGRRFGLSCDQLLAAEVVLADGRVVPADAHREPELFWALRGVGAGAFGVVTSLVLRTWPAVAACDFACHWGADRAVDVIDHWQRWAPDAPDEVDAELVVRAPADPLAPPQVVVFGVVAGATAAAAGALIEELSVGDAGRPDRTQVVELPAAESYRRFFAGEEVPADLTFGGRPPDRRPGLRLVRSDFFDRPLPAPAIAALVGHLAEGRTRGQVRTLEFIPWGGAIGRVPAAATAFVHRGPRFLLQHDLQAWGPDRFRSAGRRWLADSWRGAHPYATGLVYPNFPDPELPDWELAYYGTNLPRIRAAKAAYDPADLFRFGQPIRIDGRTRSSDARPSTVPPPDAVRPRDLARQEGSHEHS